MHSFGPSGLLLPARSLRQHLLMARHISYTPRYRTRASFHVPIPMCPFKSLKLIE